MTLRHVATVLLCGGVIVAGCNGDDGDGELKVDNELRDVDELQGAYVSDLLFVAEGEEEQIIDGDDRVVADRLEAPEVVERVPQLREIENIDARDDVVRKVLDTVGVYQVREGVDPLALATALREQDESASPVHVVAFSSHWRYSPGTPARPLSGVQLPRVESPASDGRTVAVIDTGVLDVTSQSATGQLLDGVQPLGPEDIEDPSLPDEVKGHGTFIGSLIRQIDPSLTVTVAALGPVQASSLLGHETRGIDPAAVSDELQLLVAVVRLTDHLIENEIDTAALNLSLGAVATIGDSDATCEDADRAAWGIRAAIDYWNEADWPDDPPPVIAAAGNHDGDEALDPEAAFVPGAFSDVYAVVATDAKGVDAPFTFRACPNDETAVKAPGVDLVGLRGVADADPADEQLWAWGGTSFATALVSAQTAATGTVSDVPTTAVTPTPAADPPDVLVINAIP
jgi:hypothetical protein